jgi:hypothetical protein
MSVGQKTTQSRVQLSAAGAVTGDPIRATASNAAGSSSENADTSAGYTVGQWCHAAGVFVSSTSRVAYLNGGNSGSNSSPVTSANWNTLLLGGRYLDSVLGFWYSGDVAEAAVWNVALTADEIAHLAAGYSPLTVRPHALVHYVPGLGRGGASGGEVDWDGGGSLTRVADPGLADHPRIIYPSRGQRIFVPAAAAAGFLG